MFPFHPQEEKAMPRKYYEAYEDRYRQIHEQDLQWFSDSPSPIVAETIRAFGISPRAKLLEIGCGEGRDASFLLAQGFDLLATDISPEAIAYCRRKFPAYAAHFQVADCVGGKLDGTFDFLYAVAVLHMLVDDGDRDAFYRFLRLHLSPGGIALICTMGDGKTERRTDIRTAFDLNERVHEASGKTVHIAGTSCRIVTFTTFEAELAKHGFQVLRQGVTAVEPDFPQMMFAVVGEENGKEKKSAHSADQKL